MRRSEGRKNGVEDVKESEVSEKCRGEGPRDLTGNVRGQQA